MTPDDLRDWRQRRDLSRRHAATLLGIPTRTLETLEHGRAPSSALWGPLELLTGLLDQETQAVQRRHAERADDRLLRASMGSAGDD